MGTFHIRSPAPQQHYGGGNSLRSNTAARDSTTPSDTSTSEDMLLALVEKWIAQMWAANSIIGYIVSVLGVIIYLLSIYMIAIQIVPSLGSVPAALRSGKMWQLMTQSMPLFIWIILAIVSVPLFSPIAGTSNAPSFLSSIGPYAHIVTACIVLAYAFVNRRGCKQWLLVAAAVILFLYGVMQTDFFSSTSVFTSFLSKLLPFSAIAVIVLVIINHYVVLPKCANRALAQ
jgi:hypothetical protein